jgi:hypothetical protein
MVVESKRRLLVLLAGVSTLVGGCLSPTLPLPPPSPPEVTETDVQGVYRVTGTVPANSHVTTWNLSSDLSFGQQTRGNGAYHFLVTGEQGDPMLIYYVIATDQSDATDFRLP